MDTATLTCPYCRQQQKVIIPADKCLPMHKCEHCEKIITVPKKSEECCVICQYSDKRCPVSRKK